MQPICTNESLITRRSQKVIENELWIGHKSEQVLKRWIGFIVDDET